MLSLGKQQERLGGNIAVLAFCVSTRTGLSRSGV